MHSNELALLFKEQRNLYVPQLPLNSNNLFFWACLHILKQRTNSSEILETFNFIAMFQIFCQ